MPQNAQHIGKLFQGVAGILTALTVLATVIFTLLGVFGVVDMQGVQTEGPALALGYVVALGAFALSPLVAVGIVARRSVQRNRHRCHQCRGRMAESKRVPW